MSNLFVKKLSALGTLSGHDRQALEDLTAAARRHGARRDLIRKGDRPGPVLVMLDGWACRYEILPEGSRQITAIMMPGDSCDLHVSSLAEMDHSIGTLTPARVATISRAEIDTILEKHPAIEEALWMAQLIDEATLRAWIVSMGRRESVSRVAHLICELYLRARNVGLAANNEFALPLTQVVLADALGLTPVHINRVLKTLRESGAMTSRRGWIVILDPVLLATLAGFDENYLHRRLRQAVPKRA